MSEFSLSPVVPQEGLFVFHLFFKINFSAWKKLDAVEQKKRRNQLMSIVDAQRAQEKTQVVTLAMVAKADLGLMVVTPDLVQGQRFEKNVRVALGDDVATVVYSYFSMTEKSEYTTTEEQYRAEMEKKGITEGSSDYEKEIEAFRKRYHSYTHDRMYPTLPDWKCFCFYPMSKRRKAGQNWYGLPFEQRKELMGGHARSGRKYAGKILQLISGSTGLDDWEWGVTLFAHDAYQIKSIVYEMRFDEVSHTYGEFGPFYQGLQLPLPTLLTQLGLD